MSTESPTDLVIIDIEGSIAFITVQNPPLNILTREVKQHLKEAFIALGCNHAVRVVIIKGVGEKAFCAGANIREFPERFEESGAQRDADLGHAMIRAIVRCPLPVIACIEGHCYGGGAEIAIACDFRVAGEGVRIGFPEVKRGVFPGNGGTQILPRVVGIARARQLIMSGKILDGPEAHRIGLIDQLVPAGEAFEYSKAKAQELASNSGVAVRLAKELVGFAVEHSLEEGLALERQRFLEIFKTEDVREGVAAFFEKREPHFRHR